MSKGGSLWVLFTSSRLRLRASGRREGLQHPSTPGNPKSLSGPRCVLEAQPVAGPIAVPPGTPHEAPPCSLREALHVLPVIGDVDEDGDRIQLAGGPSNDPVTDFPALSDFHQVPLRPRPRLRGSRSYSMPDFARSRTHARIDSRSPIRIASGAPPRRGTGSCQASMARSRVRPKGCASRPLGGGDMAVRCSTSPSRAQLRIAQ